MRSLVATIGVLAGISGLAGSASALAVPIPSTGVTSLPAYRGSAAVPHPIGGAPKPPQNPFMAPNGKSSIHDDAYQTNAYWWSGPLGRSPRVFSDQLTPQGDCGSITFDSAGRIVSICVGLGGPTLYMFNAATLDKLATFSLPPRDPSTVVGNNIFQDFTGGGYFFLDNHDRVITGTTTGHIYVIAETPGAPGFTLQHDYDLSGYLRKGERLNSALPDWSGRLWFVARKDGVVGTVAPASGRVKVIRLGNGSVGEIENSFAVGKDGVYIATNRAMYRFVARRDGTPSAIWSARYPNILRQKLGQVDDGTGTTPAIMQGGYVTITDNADPMDVVVYRTAAHPSIVRRIHGKRRRIALSRTACIAPVFARGASATENSLIVAGRSLIVENNYGYSTPTDTSNGKVTAPGFARVDLNRNGNGCRVVWTNRTERAPSVVPKVSISNGLIYAYTKDPDPTGGDPWFWTTLDFRTGKVVFKRLAGTGVQFNNNYSGIVIGPNRTAYLGALGGIEGFRDG